MVLNRSPSGTVGITFAGQWNHTPSIQGIYDTVTGSCREQKSEKMKIHHRYNVFSVCEVKCQARIGSTPFMSWEELLLFICPFGREYRSDKFWLSYYCVFDNLCLGRTGEIQMTSVTSVGREEIWYSCHVAWKKDSCFCQNANFITYLWDRRYSVAFT